MDAHFQTMVQATGNQDESAVCEMIMHSLSEGVSKNLRPHCAVLFSGGVDSSLIAALAARNTPDIMLLTVGFAGSNDIEWAPAAAKLLGLEKYHILKLITLVDVKSTKDVMQCGYGKAMLFFYRPYKRYDLYEPEPRGSVRS